MARFLSAFLAVVFFAFPALAEKDPVNTSFIGSVAISVADLVAYFKKREGDYWRFRLLISGMARIGALSQPKTVTPSRRIHKVMPRSLAATAPMRSASAVSQASFLKLGPSSAASFT